jgi:hypothetical protein
MAHHSEALAARVAATPGCLEALVGAMPEQLAASRAVPLGMIAKVSLVQGRQLGVPAHLQSAGACLLPLPDMLLGLHA